MSGTFKQWMIALAAAVLYFGLAGSARAQADVFHIHELVDGGAEAYAGDCPDYPPTAPVTCTEWILLLFNATLSQGGAGMAPPKGPGWLLQIVHHTLIFDGVDSLIETNVGSAVVPVTDYAYDTLHLSSAGVNVEHATLDDGTEVRGLIAVWTAKSDRIVYGHDSPATGAGFTHFHGPCVTTNILGNQKVRAARMSAVINDVAYEYDGDFGVISSGNFHYLSVVSGRCN